VEERKERERNEVKTSGREIVVEEDGLEEYGRLDDQQGRLGGRRPRKRRFMARAGPSNCRISIMDIGQEDLSQ